jgi:hypothetical protein
MSPSPFEVPVKASEAAVLADITFQLLENRRLQEGLRNRLASRAAGLGLSSIRPYWGSLQHDPVHASSFYLAVDALTGGNPPVPLLLRMALASAPASALFPKSMLIGRMRPGGGREVVVNAASFGPGDTGAIDTFATKIDRAFLPRPQGSAPSITVETADPEAELPAAFDGFRTVQRSTGINTASIAAAPGTADRTLAVAVWSAIRAGWRDGYNLEAEPMALDSPDLAQAVRAQVVFTRFRAELTEAAAQRGGEEHAGEDFGRRFAVAETIYQFEPEELAALHSRFGPALSAAERLFDIVRQERVAAGHGRVFDFEIRLPASADVRAAFYCQQWLRTRGRTATLVAPVFDTVEEAKLHGAVARHFGATLSFSAIVLNHLPHPNQWAGGRWNCRMRGDISAARIQAIGMALRS